MDPEGSYSARSWLVSLWRDHSLSVVLLSAGGFIMISSIPLYSGMWFDLVSQLGGGFFTGGIMGLASGPLRERNKPEE